MTTSCLPRALRLLASAVLALTALSLRAANPAAFDIPAQPAPAALKLFSKQSGAQVVYIHDDLKSVTTKALKGEFEPADALAQLFDGSGYGAEPTGSGNFTIARQVGAKPGSIEGYVREEKSGRGVPGARVAIAGTDQFVLTDNRGRFSITDAPSGEHELRITAETIQDTKVTDVTVRAGHKLTLSSINVPAKSADVMKLEPYVVSAKKNDGVVELDPYSVEGRRERPFTVNMDIPRTINDVQPYYIFDAKAIDASGSVNIEDFLKQRLSMNTSAQTNSQDPVSALGNTSSINLRGVGSDKTLVLVNGRRVAGVSLQDLEYQADLNGIPISAVERIEVLPSSASGIYGGNAIGGVVNVILKREYHGGEIRTRYDNTFDSDSPRKSVAINTGLTVDGGKTQLAMRASWADARSLLLRDRAKIFSDNLADIQRRSPSFINTSTSPFLGSLPNIVPTSSAVSTLVLRNGNVSLGSRNTFVPAGTSQGTARSELEAGLLANAGKWNLDFPLSTQLPTGLLRPFGSTPETKSLHASLRRQLSPTLSAFTEISWTQNNSESVFNPVTSFLTVPANSPANPFTTAVRVRTPDSSQIPVTTRSQTRGATLGIMAELPHGWLGTVDYTFSENRFSNRVYSLDAVARNADILSGVLNPFVDSLLFPLKFDKYLSSNSFTGTNRLHSLDVRGSGSVPLFSDWKPSITFGLGSRVSDNPERIFRLEHPFTTVDSYELKYFSQKAKTLSGYLETSVPLIGNDERNRSNTLELQLAGRVERFVVDAGTAFEQTFFGQSPASVVYGPPTVNGAPIFSKARYSSQNYTVGIKYEPIRGVTLRASRSTAFLPPLPSQLAEDPTVYSPGGVVNGNFVDTVAGGNPHLDPQSSRSLNIGFIWQPAKGFLNNLRFNAEYYKIEQFNAIGSLGAQDIVDSESLWPDRVKRDNGGGITLVDTRLLNLYRRETEGWDLSLQYFIQTASGRIELHAIGSTILHLKTQYSRTQPEVDAAGYHPLDGNGTPKHRGSLTVNWLRGRWTAAWTARYTSAYRMYGVAGGPTSTRFFNGQEDPFYIVAQGSDTVSSQVYHDLMLGYSFDNDESRKTAWKEKLLSGITVQCGIGNHFDKVPPLDANYVSNYYVSPFGDMRLRNYWISLRKSF